MGSLFVALALSAQAVTIDWAGRTWLVREWSGGPGPNDWSPSCVWTDAAGQLHISVTNIGGTWYCGEVSSTQSLGYGEYRWHTVGRPDLVESNTVIGLFTYLDEYHEVDIEFTYAFAEPPTNLHYTVQPYWAPGHQNYRYVNPTSDYTTHRFIWNPRRIEWQSWYGHTPEPADSNAVFAAWTYEGADVPNDTNEHVHMNVWLYDGQPPVTSNDVDGLKVVLADFAYVPSTGMVIRDDFEDDVTSNIWVRYNDGGGIHETNGVLSLTPGNSAWYSQGYRTKSTLAEWQDDGLTYIFSALLRTLQVTTASTTVDEDMWAYFGIVLGSNDLYDAYWASNAMHLRAGYDLADDALTISLYWKTNQTATIGDLRFSGVISNAASYFITNGLEITFALVYSNYQVAVYDGPNPVYIHPQWGATTGLHGLGNSLYDACFLVGAQNSDDGRGRVVWEEARVEAAPQLGSSAGPPPEEPLAGNVVQVGSVDYSATWRLPIDTTYRKSRSQTLCTASEIGRSGLITQLLAHIVGPPPRSMNRYTIRIQHTALAVAPASFSNSGWTVVYQAHESVPTDHFGWYAFNLTNGFDYNSASNLLIDFSFTNAAKSAAPLPAATYSTGTVNRTYGVSADRDDPFDWTTGPGGKKYVYSGPRFPNLRLVFSNGAVPVPPLDLRDDFNDEARDPGWDLEGDWSGAQFAETGGLLRVRSGSSIWQTSGYISSEPVHWDDDGGWFVFSAMLSTVQVDSTRSGDDYRAVLELCSDKSNSWASAHAITLEGRYDADLDSIQWVFLTKTNYPGMDLTERYAATLDGVSGYLGTNGGIRLSIVLGNNQYDVRGSDASGLPLPVSTNSGASRGPHGLESKLHSAYWIVGGMNVGTNRGSVGWDWTELRTSRPPALVLAGAGQTSTDGSGTVTITPAVHDPDGDACRLRIEASTNGGAAWFGAWLGAVTSSLTASIPPTQTAVHVFRAVTTNAAGNPATNSLSLSWDTRNAANPADLNGRTCTGAAVRLFAEDLDLPGTAVTSTAFMIDNEAPSPALAGAAIEAGALFTFAADLEAAWSNFTDSGSGLGGYYYALSDGGGTTGGVWTTALSGVATGATVEATNRVHAWAADAAGNLSVSVSDDIIVLGPGGDWDADALANGDEAGQACDPLDRDSDNDEMADGWEVDHDLDPTNAVDALDNPDGDRYDNRNEYFWNTDPNSGTSHLFFVGAMPAGSSGFEVRWNTSTGRLYFLERAHGPYSNDIPWTPAPGFAGRAGVAGWLCYTDGNVTADAAAYKVSVGLPPE